MTPAEARAILDRHYAGIPPVLSETGQTFCAFGCRGGWPCDAHSAATAYLKSVAVVGAATEVLRRWDKEGTESAVMTLHIDLRAALAEAAAKETV